MSQQYAVMPGGPNQEGSILDARQANVMNPHNIDLGVPAQQAGDDPTLQISPASKVITRAGACAPEAGGESQGEENGP